MSLSDYYMWHEQDSQYSISMTRVHSCCTAFWALWNACIIYVWKSIHNFSYNVMWKSSCTCIYTLYIVMWKSVMYILHTLLCESLYIYILHTMRILLSCFVVYSYTGYTSCTCMHCMTLKLCWKYLLERSKKKNYTMSSM